jgi:Holliday junction resolvasome RuvABC ATP-dependent DNA helicase subunit
LVQFFGQTKLLKEVEALENEIRRGESFNILLSAPSGYGKTTLALKIIKDTCGFNRAYLSNPPNFSIYYDDKDIVFVDEVHILDPQELIYPYLDLGYPTYILATNELGLLKEPMINRCIPLIFDDYGMDDICNIASSCLQIFHLDKSIILSVAEKCKLNPRVTKVLCTRLSYLFMNYGIPKCSDDLDTLVESILNISANGLNPMDRNYLALLRDTGGRASLTSISNGLHIGKNTILSEIEPNLIHMKLIRISSRGRELL